MNNPQDRRYSKDHEWAKLEGALVRTGITDYAQKELGDVVFVEVPAVGRNVSKGESFANVESVKAVSDIYAPVSGEVVEVNTNLSSSPEQINESPFDNAWIAIIRPTAISELEELMEASTYDKYLAEVAK